LLKDGGCQALTGVEIPLARAVFLNPWDDNVIAISPACITHQALFRRKVSVLEEHLVSPALK
jgi:hypothetical protein